MIFAQSLFAQTTPDFKSLGRKAFKDNEYSAAAYFMYADYLRDTTNFDDYIIAGYLLAYEEEYDKASSMYSKIKDTIRLESLSDSLKYYYNSCSATLAQHFHHYVDALNYCKYLDSRPWVHELKYKCFQGLGLYDKAIDELNIYKQFKTSDPFYVNCLMGRVYRLWGRYDDAIKYLEQAIRLDPNHAFGYYELGWCYELNGDDTTAMKYYNHGIERSPDTYAYIYLMRGEMHLKHGNAELAKNDFKKVLELDKIVEDGSCRHYALHFLGDDEGALRWMNRLIKDNPLDPGHYYDKACLCGRIGLISESVDALEMALKSGYKAFSHIKDDDDIDPIRNTEKFQEIISKYYAIYVDELRRLQ